MKTIICFVLLWMAGVFQALGNDGMSPQGNADVSRELLVLVTTTGNENLRGFVIDPILEQSLAANGWRVTGCGYGQLTPAHLDAADAVVMIQQPYSTNVEGLREFEEAAPLIYNYIESGGGALFILDDRYFLVFEPANRFLERFDVQVPRHAIIERDETRMGTLERSRTVNYIRTRNLNRAHPITAAIQELVVPVGRDRQMLHPVVWGPDTGWEAVVRAEKTAWSHDHETGGDVSYETEPVLMAIREWDTTGGRLAILPMHSTLGFLHGSHPRWDEGFLFQNGQLALLVNSIEWIAAAAHTGRGEMPQVDMTEGMYTDFPPVPNEGRDRLDVWQDGVLVQLEARPTEAELHRWRDQLAPHLSWAALILPESEVPTAEAMDDWQALCAEVSTDDFLLIPSAHTQDSFENVVAALNPQQWPARRRARAVNHISREVLGHPVLLQPEDNPWPAVNIGGFQGIVFAEYAQGALYRDYSALFRRLQAEDWFLIPHVLFRDSTPEQVADQMAHGAWRAQVASPTPSAVPEHLPYLFHNVRITSLTRGPVFRHAVLAGPGLVEDPWEGAYYLWNGPGDRAEFLLELEQLPANARVEVLRNGRVWRRYKPETEDFSVALPLASTEASHTYWAEVWVDDECVAVSPFARTRARDHWAHGGGDRMNLYHNMIFDHPRGFMTLRDRLATLSGGVLFNLGWGDDARLKSATPSYLRSPAGREWGPPSGGIRSMRFAPYIRRDGVTEYNISKPDRAGYVLAAEEMAIIEETLDRKEMTIDGVRRVVPAEWLAARTRYFIPRWENFGIVMTMVEVEVEALQDLTDDANLPVRLLNLVARVDDWYRQIIVQTEAEQVMVYLPGQEDNAPLQIDGFKQGLMYPDPMGAVIIQVLDDAEYQLRAGPSGNAGPRLQLWTDVPGGLAAGETFQRRFLVALTSGHYGDGVDEALAAMGVWRADAARRLNLSQGTFTEWAGLLRLEAADGVASGQVDVPPARMYLPVSVAGMHDFQPVYWRDTESNDMVLLESLDGIAYRSLPTGQQHAFVVGPALAGSYPALRIDPVELSSRHFSAWVHNPTDEMIQVTLSPSTVLPFEAPPKHLRLQPGEDRLVTWASGD